MGPGRTRVAALWPRLPRVIGGCIPRCVVDAHDAKFASEKDFGWGERRGRHSWIAVVRATCTRLPMNIWKEPRLFPRPAGRSFRWSRNGQSSGRQRTFCVSGHGAAWPMIGPQLVLDG
jgi:hypothetical protein